MAAAAREVRERSGAPLDALGELADALAVEVRMIDELRQALLRQRSGVAADDPAAIDDSVSAMARTLLTLEEARRRRLALTGQLVGGAPVPLTELARVLGPALPAPLAAAIATVRRAALDVAREVAINQHILRRALEAGDAFLQQLFSGAAPAPAYGTRDRGTDAGPASGVLLDRTA